MSQNAKNKILADNGFTAACRPYAMTRMLGNNPWDIYNC